MKKHILFVVENNSYPADVRVRNEAEAAKEFGYDVTVIAPVSEQTPSVYQNINGIDVYRHYIPFEAKGKSGFFIEYSCALFWEFILALKIYLKKPFHYIHSANPPDHVFIIALLFKLAGVKYVFDHHDISPENYIAKFGKKDLFFNFLLLFERLTFKCADIIISTNESYKKLAVSRGRKPPQRVFVVRNGPNLSRVHYMKPNISYRNGFDYMVAYVGAIGSQEGLENLLYAIEYIVYKRRIENTKFMIIGRGPQLDELKAVSKRLNIEKFVTFTGYIPYREFYEILATSDICINPEHRNEFTDRSTMLKIMDYMVCGKPIVQFKTTEGKFTAGNSAIYVENNDNIEFAEAIVALLNDPCKRREMGQVGKNRIECKLKWDLQKANLRKAYEHLELLRS
jgi:glycosyltransferase involved in cell wall biosynthesis